MSTPIVVIKKVAWNVEEIDLKNAALGATKGALLGAGLALIMRGKMAAWKAGLLGGAGGAIGGGAAGFTASAIINPRTQYSQETL